MRTTSRPSRRRWVQAGLALLLASGFLPAVAEAWPVARQLSAPPRSHATPREPARANAAAKTATAAARPPFATAERSPAVRATDHRPAARAVRRSGPIVIDGSLRDAAWEAAPVERGFWQRDPHEGAPPRFHTEFRVLYDDDALYVGVRADDPDPAAIRGLLTRRDQNSPSDWITVAIDSYFDRRTAFLFALNPAGVQRDAMLYDDTKSDDSWNAVWAGATAIDARGWTAEFRIPYSQLRFDSSRHTWGLQVSRTVERTQEQTMWAPWPKASDQRVSLFGTLRGLDGLRPARRIELIPYAIAGLSSADVAPGDPFSRDLAGAGGAGLDARYGLGSSFTLSATVNPDFGQVEADPSQVNLTANETFFQEKRPFFVEGANLFQFGLGQGGNTFEQLFYSRRIGAAPHLTPPDGDYVDEPKQTTIYGAAKLTGKTASGWSVGALDAITAPETARVAYAGASMPETRVPVEPLTNYGVLHVKKDFNDGRTTVGAALTGVNRSLADANLAANLHDQAYAGGLSLEHSFAGREWAAELKLFGSYVHGSPAAIAITQTESPHYFQRPDASYLHFDPNRTSLAGFGALGSIGKQAGGHWRYALGADTRSPGLELNDLGFQQSGDYYNQWLWGQYQENDGNGLFHSYQLESVVWSMWNYGGEHINGGAEIDAGGTLQDYWSGSFGISYNTNYEDPTALRGGPSIAGTPSYHPWMSLSTDSRRPLRGSLAGDYNWSPQSGSSGLDLTTDLTLQARSNLDISIGPTFSHRVDDLQYITQVADPSGAPHYILGRIDQTTAALTLRVDYTYSPTLSVQLYAQPFVSTGAYTAFKEPNHPHAARYADRFHRFTPAQISETNGTVAIDENGDGAPDFSFDRPDFSFDQLRSNLVVRWEYRPGSTLFVIWSHARTHNGANGAFALGRNAGELASFGGDNVVLCKLNFWLSL